MTTGLADELKGRTQAAHTRAERHALQGRLVRGELPRAEHAAYLAQLRAVWEALDRALAARAAADPRLATIYRDYHPHAWRVEDDLAELGAAGLPLTGATRALVADVDRMAASRGPDGAGLIGVWYVLEGSANGGRYIAAAMRRALGPGVPVRTFDPHGELQRERWAAWRTGLDACSFSPEERGAIIDAATRTFDAIWGVMEELGEMAVARG